MSVQILLINGSPRKPSNSGILLEKASAGVHTVKNVDTSTFEFYEKTIAPCKGTCYSYCKRYGRCITNDDLTAFSQAFWRADGIIWVVPTYHAGPPAPVKAALDRLPNLMFNYTEGEFPRLNKTWGVIVHGHSSFGGQELNAQFFFNSALQLKCIPIAGDSPQSVTAVMGRADTLVAGSICSDQAAMEGAVNLGRRVAEMAKILQGGLNTYDQPLDMIYDAHSVQTSLLARSYNSDKQISL